MTGAENGQPVALGTVRGRWLVTVTVLASGMAFLDATAVQVALPSIGRELDSSLAGRQMQYVPGLPVKATGPAPLT